VEGGPVLLRLDVAERAAADLAWRVQKAGKGQPVFAPADLASRLAVKAELLPGVLRALGFRLRPAAALEAGQYGPPAPPLMQMPQRRRTGPRRSAPQEVTDGPFAALAALRP
jgi:ATP-dependent RNA helicase SUPV3L1/SUV3